jgi:hypothetical protein
MSAGNSKTPKFRDETELQDLCRGTYDEAHSRLRKLSTFQKSNAVATARSFYRRLFGINSVCRNAESIERVYRLRILSVARTRKSRKALANPHAKA